MNPSATAIAPLPCTVNPVKALPRLGFAGVGWIGRNRLDAIARSGAAEICLIADPAADVAANAADAYEAKAAPSFEHLLDANLDGIVVATPSALHASQGIAALRAGKAVFCQKPLGRDASETAAVVEAARRADRLLGIDFSYRHTLAMKAVHHLIHSGEIGEITAVEAAFHNAYGPDKAWFYDRKQSGGGCLLDLGIHLVDLTLWSLNFPRVRHVHGVLRQRGRPLKPGGEEVEDYAAGLITFDSGATLQLSCSWGAPAGCDARIELTFFGTRGGACFRNVGGSFYDFTAEHFLPDRSRRILVDSPDHWGGRAAVEWARQLAAAPGFHLSVSHAVEVARTLDLLYDS